MTTTYSHDPASSPKDAVRFYAQDTDEGRWLLTDEEISFLLAQYLDSHNSDPLYVASVACTTIAAKYTGEVAVSENGVSVDVSALKRDYLALASALRQQYHDRQGIVGPDLETAAGGEVAPKIFGVGMMDNSWAGRQDYGDRQLVEYYVEEHPGL